MAKMNGYPLIERRDQGTLNWFHSKCEAALRVAAKVDAFKKTNTAANAKPSALKDCNRPRRVMTDEKRAGVLKMWREGAPLRTIARDLDVDRMSARNLLKNAGEDVSKNPLIRDTQVGQIRTLLLAGKTAKQVAAIRHESGSYIQQIERELIAAGKLKKKAA